MADTIQSIAAQIPAGQAQIAVAKVMAALGCQFDWNSDTLDWVAEAIKPVADSLRGVPDCMDQDDAAVEFWQSIAG